MVRGCIRRGIGSSLSLLEWEKDKRAQEWGVFGPGNGEGDDGVLAGNGKAGDSPGAGMQFIFC